MPVALCRMDPRACRANDFRVYVSKNVVRRRAVVAKKRFAERISFCAVECRRSRDRSLSASESAADQVRVLLVFWFVRFSPIDRPGTEREVGQH